MQHQCFGAPRGALTGLAALVALSSACGLLDKLRSTDDEKADSARTADSGTETGVAAAAAVDHPAPVHDGPVKPGPVYFVVDGGHKDADGIVRLQDGEFKLVLKYPVDSRTGLVMGQDGHAYALIRRRIFALDGPDALTSIAHGFSPRRMVVTPESEIWATDYLAIAHWDGKWTRWEDDPLGPDAEGWLGPITYDRSGRVWATSWFTIHAREDGRWRRVDLGSHNDTPGILQDVQQAPNGTIVAVSNHSLYRFESLTGLEIQAVATKNGEAPRRLHGMSTGDVLLEQDAWLTRVGPEGELTRYHADTDFYGECVLASAVDGRDRLWVSTLAGVSIVGPGEERVFWPSSSIPELTGHVSGILAVGDGPELVPPPGLVSTGTVTGALAYEGPPVRNTEVALCLCCPDGPDVRRRYTTQTDSEGRFTFEGVLLNGYRLWGKVGSKWRDERRREWHRFATEEGRDIGTVEVLGPRKRR